MVSSSLLHLKQKLIHLYGFQDGWWHQHLNELLKRLGVNAKMLILIKTMATNDIAF